MPYGTKHQKRDLGQIKVDQHFSPDIDDYEPAYGADNAKRVLLWDATGKKALMTDDNPGRVKVVDSAIALPVDMQFASATVKTQMVGNITEIYADTEVIVHSGDNLAQVMVPTPSVIPDVVGLFVKNNTGQNITIMQVYPSTKNAGANGVWRLLNNFTPSQQGPDAGAWNWYPVYKPFLTQDSSTFVFVFAAALAADSTLEVWLLAQPKG